MMLRHDGKERQVLIAVINENYGFPQIIESSISYEVSVRIQKLERACLKLRAFLVNLDGCLMEKQHLYILPAPGVSSSVIGIGETANPGFVSVV